MAEQVGAIEVRISADPSKLQAGLASASKALSNFGSKATSVGRNLSLSVTAPLVLAGRQAIRASNEFEGSMTKIKGLVGVAGAEVDKMGEQAKRMAVNFGASASDAGDALFYITSAGLRGSDAMGVLAASLKASAAGLGEASTVADLATSALNAYGTANISAIQATDILTKSVREGKLETTELASSMGRVLPLASAMGVGFEEVGATFAALSRTGTNAAEAATQLRGILSGLLTPTTAAQEELERLGLNAGDLRKQIKEEGLLSALETLKTAFEGNEESAALVFGNVRALSGIMDLLGANVDTTRQIFDSLKDTTGATNSAFEEMSKSGAFKLQQMQKQLNLVMTEFGDELKLALIPVLQQLSKFLSNTVDSFKGLDSSTRQMIVKMGLIAAAIGPALIVVGQLSIAMAGLASAFAFLVSPLGLVVAGIAAVVAGFVYLVDNWEAVKERLGDMGWWRNALISMLQFVIDYNPFSLLIDGYNKIASLMGGEPISNPFTDMSEGLDDLKVETNEYEHEFGTFTEAVVNGAKKAAEALGFLQGAAGGFGGGGGDLDPTTTMKPDAGGIPIADEVIDEMAEIEKAMQTLPTLVETIDESVKIGAESAIGAIGSIIGAMRGLAGDSKALALFEIAANTARGIASAVAAGAGIPFPGNLVAIATGITSVLGGIAQAKSALSSAPAFAQGGMVTGPTLAMVGDNASGKEAIIPFEKMGAFMNMMGGSNVNVNITGEFDGDALRLVLDKSSKDLNNLR